MVQHNECKKNSCWKADKTLQYIRIQGVLLKKETHINTLTVACSEATASKQVSKHEQLERPLEEGTRDLAAMFS